MKKLITFIVTAVLTFTVMPSSQCRGASDKEVVYNGMVFTIAGTGNELALAAVREYSDEIVVPDTVEGMPVTQLDSKAFKGKKNIKKVTLPDTMYSMDRSAFAESSLTSVNIPKSMIIIPDAAFQGCKQLENVEIHDGVLICSQSAFYDASYQPPAEITDRLAVAIAAHHGSYAILSDDTWTYEVIRDYTEESYYVSARYNGKSYDVTQPTDSQPTTSPSVMDTDLPEYEGELLDITVPESFLGIPVTHINKNSFRDKPIRSITFPASVKYIPVYFNNPTLTNLTFLGDDVKLQKFLDYMTISNTSISEIALPVSELPITCKECPNLKKVDLTGHGDLVINDDAFRDSAALEQVDFSENYDSIYLGSHSFDGTAVKSVSLDCPCTVDRNAFTTSLETAEFLSDAVIKAKAFSDCTSLKNVSFKGDFSLGTNAFLNCTALKNVDLDITKPFDGSVFNGCTALMTIDSKQLFDEKTGEFDPKYDEYIRKNFYAADDVGFINEYVMAQVKRIVRENVTDDMSDIEKIRVLHDWVCANTVYVNGGDDIPEYHTDAVILLKGEAVCEGYARLCDLLYREAGIESYFLAGRDHAWNIVKAGGHYFHADATWDDGAKISHRYLMKSDSEFRADGGSHSVWTQLNPSSLHTAADVLPKCLYCQGDVNTDGAVSAADLVKMSRVLMGMDVAEEDDIVLYDLDLSGGADAFDLVLLRKKIPVNYGLINLKIIKPTKIWLFKDIRPTYARALFLLLNGLSMSL